MSLDQYVYRVNKSAVIDDFGFKDDLYKEINIMVMDFGSVWELQNYMSNLYESRGGKGEFNCKYIKVEEDDIKDLESAIKEGTLKVEHPYDMELIESFIEIAKKVFEVGDCIYYYSWW